jgi:hypothetical protein
MLSQFDIRVRLPNGTVTTVRLQAISPGIAIEQVRAQYGANSFMGILESRYL